MLLELLLLLLKAMRNYGLEATSNIIANVHQVSSNRAVQNVVDLLRRHSYVKFTFSVSRKVSRLKIISRKLSGENVIFV